MKIGIITDSIYNGPISVGNYTKALVKELNRKNNVELFFLRIKRLNLYNKLLAYNKIIKTCEKENVDILHIPHLGRPSPSLWLFLKKRVKIIITNHGMANLILKPEICYGKHLCYKRIKDTCSLFKWKISRNIFDKMITVSNSEKINISTKLKIPKEKIKVIYHGVDHKNFKVMCNKYRVKKELKLKYGVDNDFLLHVSSYQPKKNVEGIINAFKIFKNEKIEFVKKIKLIIIGKHPSNLKRLVEKLKLCDDVIFLGHVPYEDLPKFYNLALCFVFPSFHESFGMPILEAMACGCPVITSNVFSMPEIAGDSAILVNPYDISEIAEMMHTIITDNMLRKKLKIKGLNRAKKFTWENCAKNHIKVYEEVLNT